VPEDDGSAEIALRKALAGRYNTVRPFLALLGESPALAAAQGGKQILAAVRTLPGLARRTASKRSLKPHEVDTALVPRTWRPAACLTLATNAVIDLDHRVLRAGGGADAPPGPAHRR
jgi:hypothetical protein